MDLCFINQTGFFEGERKEIKGGVKRSLEDVKSTAPSLKRSIYEVHLNFFVMGMTCDFLSSKMGGTQRKTGLTSSSKSDSYPLAYSINNKNDC